MCVIAQRRATKAHHHSAIVCLPYSVRQVHGVQRPVCMYGYFRMRCMILSLRGWTEEWFLPAFSMLPWVSANRVLSTLGMASTQWLSDDALWWPSAVQSQASATDPIVRLPSTSRSQDYPGTAHKAFMSCLDHQERYVHSLLPSITTSGRRPVPAVASIVSSNNSSRSNAQGLFHQSSCT